ncbi:carbohydrate kinase family protein [Wocania ichthyoenteri]|uniref:carbohydrate kinase family protein n=1 Tax=Wocania ichthyoenteri TaxID=1230531 RepID=UPI00053F1929|nr:carbohydrate kinase family protein [Wocania ichthyoenteri]
MEKKFDVIVVGELNVDLIFNHIKGFPEVGKEILADDMTLTLGSSSAICASNLSSLGLKVAFIGKLGNDIFGQFIIDKLNEKGVDTSLIIIEDTLKTGATVALSYDEDRAMVTHQGAMSHLSINDIHESQLKQANHLHFSSYFFQPGFKNSLDSLFIKAKKAGLTTSLDVQWDPTEKWNLDLEKVLPLVDVFIPNEVEFQKLTRQPNLNFAIDSIQNKSRYTVIKRGKKGSVLFYDDKKISKESFLNNNIIDTIGAGDSFNAGYISKFIKGKPPEECQEYGNLMGAISTTKPGGTDAFKNLDQVMRIAKNKFNYIE